MNRRELLSRMLLSSLAGTAVNSIGCGTILHQERVDRPHSRDIDWKIAALNGLGLAFFFVPGVLAFVVDFYTGAIYLPPEGHAAGDGSVGPDQWRCHSVDPSELDAATIEQVVVRAESTPLSLAESDTRVSGIEDFEQYAQQLRRHQNDRRFGLSLHDFFTPA